VLSYPLTLSFKVIAIAPQITVRDAADRSVMYVRQKALALRENVRVFTDDSQQQQLSEIQADRIIDIGARYAIRTADGLPIGSVRQHGLRTLWSATYSIEDADGQEVGRIREENAFVKLVDGLVGEIPLVGWVATMFINPAYIVERHGQPALYVRKRPAFFEGRFTVEKTGEFTELDEQLLLNAVLMSVLLERGRG
jgi:uncharacterized protein YxjI